MAVVIRRAGVTDLPAVTQLFYNTITAINAADYRAEQIAVWRAGHANTARWLDRLATQYFIVAEEAGTLFGFGSVTPDGYIDVLYVHKDQQRKGIARQIVTDLIGYARSVGVAFLRTDVSLTARNFFANQGFKVVREQQKLLGATLFINYRMAKFL